MRSDVCSNELCRRPVSPAKAHRFFITGEHGEEQIANLCAKCCKRCTHE